MLESEELILNWLNIDLKFDPKIKHISKEFSDGYNFAEILYEINEITENQLNEFHKNTSDKRLIKENFILIKQYFHEKFDLEIRQEEFDDIANKDKSKAVVILYKLKNAIRLKQINFHNIKTSLNPETIAEINDKVRKIIDYEYYYDIFNKDLLYDLKPKEENKYDLTSNLKTVTFSEQNILQTTYSKQFSDKENMKVSGFNTGKENDNISSKISSFIQTKTTDIVSKELNKDSSIKLPNIFSNLKEVDKTRNKKNLILITNFNSPSPYSTKTKFGNGTSNIAEENKFRVSKLTENLFKLGVGDLQFNFKHSLPVFNPKNIRELDKIRKELKNKVITIDEEKKQKSYKKNLEIRLFDVPEIDFRGKNNSKESNKEKMYTEKNVKQLLPIEKRRKYCKEWHIYVEQRKIEKKIKYFSSLIKNSSIKEEIKQNEFNDEQYLSTLDINDIENINNTLKSRIKKIKLNYPIMKKIILLIIDMAMEIFFYQEGKLSDIIDIETYTKFLELFIANKPMRERVDVEARIIKEKNKEEIEINVDRLKLNPEEQNLKEDYKNYIGFWNSNIIMDKKYKGMKIDIKKLREYLPDDYEPTESEIENLTFPLLKEDNYLFGEMILELLDNKYQEKNEVKEKGKWDYIDYKIALVGLPFCGKNFIAEEIKKKYENMKIYSINNILRSYYNEYKTIIEPLENNPKFKTMKPNQIEQLKQEKENKMKEFEPKLKLIQPYINLIDSQTNNEENKTSIIIPTDELLLNILIYNIENDFPKISDEERNKNIINIQNNINNLIQQKDNLEKQIQESKKPNPKDEQNLQHLEKEIEKEKNNSVKGFILVDFPTNINQCKLLEYYLNGYVDVTSLPKSQKMKNIEKIDNLIDFNFQPAESNKTKRAGIDFIINIITSEIIVDNRFSKKKYDPLNDKIYSEYELSQELITKDKKLMERLEDNVPYYTKEHFDFYKNQYNENISKIYNFYSQFGFGKNSSDFDSNLNTINLEGNEKDINRTYQEINIEDNKEIDECEEEKVEEKEKPDEKGKKNPINKDQLLMINKENEIKDKIFNYINVFIEFLFKEKEERDKIIFLKEHPEMSIDEKEEEKDRIQFDPEFKVNEIRGANLPKKAKKEINLNLKQFHFLSDNFETVLSDLIKFNIKYEKHIGKFIYLIKRQQNDIYSRLILIQKKYRDFLNLRSDKKKVISLYCQKYNSFFTEYPSAFNSVLAINDFSEDIDRLNSALWSLINLKETVSIKELQEIKNSNFIEHELKKFYKFMVDIFLLETEKFINVINSIYNLYHKKNEEISKENAVNNKNINKNKNKKREIKKIKNKTKIVNTKEDILLDLIEIPDEYIGDENDDMSTINSQYRRTFFQRNRHKKNLDYLINHNIEIIFNNCLELVLNQQEKIESLIKSLKELMSPNVKKNIKLKKKQTESMGSSALSTFMQTKEISVSLDENVKRMFNIEKNKYKYRLCFLRSFVSRYLIIINQTSKKVFENIDNWIISSVSLQSDARKHVINKLRSLLKEKKLINEEQDINHIELDTFEAFEESKNIEKDKENKIYGKLNVDYLINDDFVDIIIKEEKDDEDGKKKKKYNKFVIKNYKIIVPNENKNVIDINKGVKLSDKFSGLDFVYNLMKFRDIYNYLKLFEVKKNVINQNIFYENFIKKYLFSKDYINKDNSDNIDDSINNNLDKFYYKSNRAVFPKTTNDKNSIINKFPNICKALKSLSSKNVKKLFSLFQINIEQPAKDEQIKENIEYDKYLNTAKIFTILALIRTETLTEKRKKTLMRDLKLKLVKNKYLTKSEFMKYKFWFENSFKFGDSSERNKKGSTIINSKSPRKVMRQKTKNFTNSPFRLDRKSKEDEQKNYGIKDLLFSIWLDEKENMINLIELLDVLRSSNYTSKPEDEDDIYFDIIFGE